MRLDFTDRNARVEIQNARVLGIDRWEADVFPMRRSVDDETHALSSNSLQVFSRQQLTLAQELHSSIQ